MDKDPFSTRIKFLDFFSAHEASFQCMFYIEEVTLYL